MHICFLCNEYPPASHGGVGSVTKTLAEALVSKGQRCSVVGQYAGVPAKIIENDAGVRVIRLPHAPVPRTNFLWGGHMVRRALEALHREDPIAVLEGPETSMAPIAPRMPFAKVVRMHGGHRFFSVSLGGRPQWWRSWQEARSLRHADHLCAVSHYVAETTRSLAGLGERPITVLPNPVNTTMFHPWPEVIESHHLLVFVGTITEKKGVRQLVRAMPEIVKRFPQARLHLIGRDTVDPATRESVVDSLSRRLPGNITSHVVFRGPVSRTELPAILAQASVCIFPSHMEALPMAWLEAMAMARPVVASRSGPGPEVIEDGVSGLLCDPHKPSSIAEQVCRLLDDERLRRRMAEAARQRVIDHFSLSKLIDRNIEYYQQCLGRTLWRSNSATC